MSNIFAKDENMTSLGEVTKNVLDTICKNWPANPFEVAQRLGDKGENKSLSSKYLYHFRKLKQLELIEMKRTGNTYIAWPIDMEKLRVIHELLKV